MMSKEKVVGGRRGWLEALMATLKKIKVWKANGLDGAVVGILNMVVSAEQTGC